MAFDWTYGFSLEDIAHMARFLGCDDRAAARQLQADWEKDEAERLADDLYHEEGAE